MRTRPLAMLAAFGTIFACAALFYRTDPVATAPSAPQADAPPKIDAEIVGTLKFRRGSIKRLVGNRFVVESPTGEVIADGLTATELAIRHPVMDALLKGAIAEYQNASRPAGPFPTLLADSETLLAGNE